MKRLGTVLVFKEGVTREEAAEALSKISDVLELDSDYTVNTYRVIHDRIHGFDDEWGGPVWYIP